MKHLENEHEEMSEIEFIIMDLSTKTGTKTLREKVEELYNKHSHHIRFEEQHLFPLLKDKIPDTIIEYLEEEHVNMMNEVKKLRKQTKQKHDKQKVLENASMLRGTHTSHIKAESKSLYPILESIEEDKIEKILQKHKEQDYSDYTPIKARKEE